MLAVVVGAHPVDEALRAHMHAVGAFTRHHLGVSCDWRTAIGSRAESVSSRGGQRAVGRKFAHPGGLLVPVAIADRHLPNGGKYRQRAVPISRSAEESNRPPNEVVCSALPKSATSLPRCASTTAGKNHTARRRAACSAARARKCAGSSARAGPIVPTMRPMR